MHKGEDTASILAEGRHLWQRVGRPNLMIKVPATPAGIAAFEQLIAEGINVNVTLLFAVETYAEVAAAYVRGLTARVAVEQASPMGWERHVGLRGAILAMRGFGASAPFGELQKHFGFTPDNIVRLAREQCARS